MPTIQLLEKKKSNCKPQEGPNKWSSECYNTTKWRRLRKARLIEHPLCEVHLQFDEVVPATEIHHIVEISQAGSKLEAMDIAFNSNNLMSLCRECHQRYHAIIHSKHSISKEDLVFLNKYKEICNKRNGDQ